VEKAIAERDSNLTMPGSKWISGLSLHSDLEPGFSLAILIYLSASGWQ